ncbi:peptidase m12a astacin [Moniliophthora roreri]|nr:peptidase m12a astacin [Moniliophthora roreri]
MSQSSTPQSMRACSPAPIPTTTSGAPSGGLNAVMSKFLWPFTKDSDEQIVALTYYFLDGTSNQREAVTNTIEIWMTYANVILDNTGQRDKANIRISFADKASSWSMVGSDANRVTDKSKPTMNLGWLADTNPPSASDTATILHEFGHALGMMHEHQSPARGGTIHLKEPSVYQYYRPLLNNDDALVKSQVIDQYNLATVSNFSRLDLKSIMMQVLVQSTVAL